jgi:hypothetical protein
LRKTLEESFFNRKQRIRPEDISFEDVQLVGARVKRGDHLELLGRYKGRTYIFRVGNTLKNGCIVRIDLREIVFRQTDAGKRCQNWFPFRPESGISKHLPPQEAPSRQNRVP